MALDHDAPYSVLFADFGVQPMDNDWNRKSFLEAKFAVGFWPTAVIYRYLNGSPN